MGMSAEHRAAIARGQAARHARARAILGPKVVPERSRCAKCKQWKVTRGNFYIKVIRNADGTPAEYVHGRCTDCEKERRRTAEDPETRRKRQQRYRNRHSAKVRQNNRESARLRYLEKHPNAKVRGPYAKSRIQDKQLEGRVKVNVDDFLAWVTRDQPALNDTEQRLVQRLKNGQKSLSVRAADAVMTRHGAHHELSHLRLVNT